MLSEKNDKNTKSHVETEEKDSDGYLVEAEEFAETIGKVKGDKDNHSDVKGQGTEQSFDSHAFFVKRFFNNLSENDLDLDNKNSKFSKLTAIYKDITDFYVKDESKLKSTLELIGAERSNTGIIPINNISKTILKIIENSCVDNRSANTSKKCLAVRSPLGSYKNVLLQYIFLTIERKVSKDEKWSKVLPFYLNFTSYEECSFKNGLGETQKCLSDDFEKIFKIIENNADKLPLFIVDGVREFDCGINNLYGLFDNKINENVKEYRLVAGVDEDYIKDKDRILNDTFIDVNVFYDIATNKAYEITKDEKRESVYDFTLKISSMKLDRGEDCTAFIQNCIDFAGDEFNLDKYDKDKINSLWQKLIDSDFISLDAYWLLKLLRSSVFEKSNKICGIYNGLKFDGLEPDKAAALAHEYESGGGNYEPTHRFWKILRKHSSLLDYFVAKHYVSRLKNLSRDRKQSDSEAEAGLRFFNKIFPKKIMVFALDEINSSQECIENLFFIAENFYKKGILGVYAQNALVFWLGRFTNDKDQVRAKELLHGFLKDLKQKTPKSNEDNILLRSIYVSLIYLKDKSALKEYLELLINDSNANEINRAFHLEYYGDTFPDTKRSGNNIFRFEDRRSNNPALHSDPKYNPLLKGVNTLRRLANDTKKQDYKCVTILQLMTYCNLIQSRKPDRENDPRVINLNADINHFEVCKEHITSFLKNASWKEAVGENVVLYFEWMKKELDKAASVDKYCTHVETRIYGDFQKIAEVQRTGWIQRQLPFTESIAEHMYNCWLMAFIFLPENSKAAVEEEGYDKNTILNMLLIHDLGEVSTGDIPREIKLRDETRKFADNENRALHPLLLIDTYPFVETNMKKFRDEWVTNWNSSTGCDDINYKIAKDIDNIQAVYKYCKYFSKINSNNAQYKFTPKDKFSLKDGDGKSIDAVKADYIRFDLKDCIGWITTLIREDATWELNSELKAKYNYNLCAKLGLTKPSAILSERGQNISKNLIFDNPDFVNIFSSIKEYINSCEETL